MSKESNEQLARRWFQEVWNERRTATIDELAAENVIGHHGPQTSRTRNDFKNFQAGLLALVPDVQVEVHDVLSSATDAVVRWRFRGTGAATGEAVDLSGISWIKIADGQIYEGWDAWNPEQINALAARAAAVQ